MKRRSWLLALCGFAFSISSTTTVFAEDVRPGDDFLKLVDAKKYAESWDVSSDFLKQSVSRAEWAKQLTKARDTIGELASRTLKDSKAETNPQGAPPGEYLIQTYESVFASQGKPFTETLPLVKGPDGRWRAVGYFVR